MIDFTLTGNQVPSLTPTDLHRLVMTAFPSDAGNRASVGVLHRLQVDGTLLVRCSGAVPNLTAWCAAGLTIAAVGAITAPQIGAHVVWEMVANPTFDGVVDGKRRRTGINAPSLVRDWAVRKLAAAGVGDVEVLGVAMWRQRDRYLVHQAARLSGIGVVVDHVRLAVALGGGVGRGRAFGFGLLTVDVGQAG